MIGTLLDDLSSSHFGIKPIESSEYPELKKIQADLKKLREDVNDLFYKIKI